MGLTAFAYGACTPETITGLVMARKGNRCLFKMSKRSVRLAENEQFTDQ